MYSVGWRYSELILVGISFIWLAFLSFLVWKEHSFVKSLFPKSGERDIRKKFEELIKEVIGFGDELGQTKERISILEKDGLKNIQEIRLVRYNPYDETGGDQSFSVSLLDKQGNGIVLTSLHARSGTRVFAKPVKSGKAEDYKLSEEEQRVIEDTLKIN